MSGHTIDRRLVTEVECGVCGLRQAVTRECVGDGCDTVFGSAHFCAVCKLYDDTNKGQFHCEGCGICRWAGTRILKAVLFCDKWVTDVIITI